jgi:hypothetical protein
MFNTRESEAQAAGQVPTLRRCPAFYAGLPPALRRSSQSMTRRLRRARASPRLRESPRSAVPVPRL